MEVSLAYIGNKYGSTVQDNTEQQINTILYPVGRPGSNPPQPGLIYFGGVNDFTVQDLHDAINSLSLGATAKARLNDLVTILTDSSARDIADFDVVKAAIINWENLVTTQFTGAARDRLLGAGSVARYSSYYWQVYNETIPDGTVTRGRGGFLRWLGWGLVGAADAIGFFVGGGGLSGVSGARSGRGGTGAGSSRGPLLRPAHRGRRRLDLRTGARRGPVDGGDL